MSPGYQATQAVHAAIAFAVEYPTKTKQWNREGHLVLLTVCDEWDLRGLSADLFNNYIPRIMCEHFEEPDIDNELTAIAFLADRPPREISRLPLALATPDDPRYLREREIRDSLRREVS